MQNITRTNHNLPPHTQKNGGNNKQWINYNRAIALECLAKVTECLSYFYCQIFTLDSAVVKQGKMLSSLGGFRTYPMNHHGETKLNCQEIKKVALNPVTVRAKETPSWAKVGQDIGKQQVLTYRWKWYAIVVMGSEVWPSVNFMHFLLQNDVFLLFSMTIEIKITSLKHILKPKFVWRSFMY